MAFEEPTRYNPEDKEKWRKIDRYRRPFLEPIQVKIEDPYEAMIRLIEEGDYEAAILVQQAIDDHDQLN